MPLKAAKASLELHLGTILGGVGSGQVRSGGLGPIVITRLSQFNCNCNCLLELSLAINKRAMEMGPYPPPPFMKISFSFNHSLRSKVSLESI